MPRPSSPLSAKAFTRCPSFTRPAPAASPLLQRGPPSCRRWPRPSSRARTEHPLRWLTGTANNKHTMLKRSSLPAKGQCWRTSPALFRPGRTHATIACERRSRHGHDPNATIRRSRAMPALDQTCLFTMYKEQRPRTAAGNRRTRASDRNTVTNLQPGAAIKGGA